MSENENKLGDAELGKISGGAKNSSYSFKYGPYFPYTVYEGDTLESIALRFATTVSVLLKLNNLASADSIRVGQTIIIPQY